jgi:small-conductance mechanosensitive channel
MTLIGKIFTVLIFILCLMFGFFSVMVAATHKNWQKVVINPPPGVAGHDPKYDVGLKAQNDALNKIIQQKETLLDNMKNELSREKAARTEALAGLQTKLAQTQQVLAQKELELAALTATHGKAAEALKIAEDTNTSLMAEVATLRGDVRNVQLDRDAQFDKVVTLTDQINQTQGEINRFTERNKQLGIQVALIKKELTAAGIKIGDSEFVSVRVEGIVTAATDKAVEISLGSDDGVRVNDQFDVYRGSKYMGRVIIQKLEPNRAVAVIDPKYSQGPLQKGDRVATKFS